MDPEQTVTARKAAMLQPVSREVADYHQEYLKQAALRRFSELGTVLEDTLEINFHERVEINGQRLPWGYEFGGEWVEIPGDFLMARYEVFVIPKEGADV